MAQRQGRSQQRATTSHAATNMNLLGQTNQGSFNYGNTNQQMRLLHLNYKAAAAKRENINQVIKDCFITKKCGVRKP